MFLFRNKPDRCKGFQKRGARGKYGTPFYFFGPHYVRDAAFREDHPTIRTSNAPRVFATLSIRLT
jgi:hypothetical protein